MAYTIVLTIHSWLRWLVLGLGVGTTLAATRGGSGAGETPAERWGAFLMMALDTQMLLGLILYLVLSPFTTVALHDFGSAMRTPSLRFWAVEHPAMMFAAVITVHVGRVLARKAKTPESKRWRLAVAAGLATFLMLLGMPWPGLPNGRTLFRF
jgi:hypothetical protein